MAKRRSGSSDDGHLVTEELVDQVTAQLPATAGESIVPQRGPVRLFGSGDFFRLWLAQVVSALGDWIGFFAIVVIADRIGQSSQGAAIGVVMMARILPGFFLGTVVGALLDRWDRKRVMVACDVGRAIVLALLPFVDTLPQLVAASFVIEVLTLLWSPAKEASVPNLVPTAHLATANSLSLVAAYGTFPLASVIFAGLAKVSDSLRENDSLGFLDLNQESIAVYFDVLTFLLSALIISTLTLPRRRRVERAPGRRVDFGGALREIREGWSFIFVNRTVRTVMLALGTGLIGGGMLVPLGQPFTSQVLAGGPAAFGLVLTALGTGVGFGVLLLSLFQRRLPKVQVFSGAVLASGASLLLGASVSTLAPALLFVSLLGVSAGGVYVLGFTILQESVADELRGRIFTALYTVVRLCLLVAFGLAPFLAGGLDSLSRRLFDNEVSLGGMVVALPGVRLTLWLAALIILVAGGLATISLRHVDDDEADSDAGLNAEAGRQEAGAER